jgi:hypothetical protein
MVKKIDVDELLEALDKNEGNQSIMDCTTSKIQKDKNDLLQKLHFKSADIKYLLNKLKDYRFVDEIKDLNYGCYVRWINMIDPTNLKVTNGGFICDMKASNSDYIISCKNTLNHYFSFRVSECLIFQKLTNSEKLILNALDYLEKNK